MRLNKVKRQSVYERVRMSLKLTPVATGRGCPVVIKERDGEIFIAMFKGKVVRMHDGEFTTLLDLSMNRDGDRWICGMEFHPEFKSNGRFYLHYHVKSGKDSPITVPMDARDVRTLCQEWTDQSKYLYIENIEEWTYGETIEKTRLLLSLKRPFSGSTMNDTLQWNNSTNSLMIALGDGGSKYDPFNLAQDEASLHGKILSMDVDKSKCQSAMEPIANTYEIPFDRDVNIIAKGIKDPVGMSHVRGNVYYVADRGQDQQSSVTISPLGDGIVDFGWRPIEGILPTSKVIDCKPIEDRTQHGPMTHVVEWDFYQYPVTGDGIRTSIAPGDSITFKSKSFLFYDLIETNSTWEPLTHPTFKAGDSKLFCHTVTFNKEGTFYARCNSHSGRMRHTIIVATSVLLAREMRCRKYLSEVSKSYKVKTSFQANILYQHEYYEKMMSGSKEPHLVFPVDVYGIVSGLYYKGSIGSLDEKYIFISSDDDIFSAKRTTNRFATWKKESLSITLGERTYFTVFGTGNGSLYLGSYNQFHGDGTIYLIS